MSLLGTNFVATAGEAQDTNPDTGPGSPVEIVEGAVLMPDEVIDHVLELIAAQG